MSFQAAGLCCRLPLLIHLFQPTAFVFCLEKSQQPRFACASKCAGAFAGESHQMQYQKRTTTMAGYEGNGDGDIQDQPKYLIGFQVFAGTIQMST